MGDTKQVEIFFDAYAKLFNNAIQGNVDAEATASVFSDCFIEAGPAGVNCGKNDEQFRSALTKGYGFYSEIGITSMDILSKEITILDDLHSMARINWRSNYRKKNKEVGKIDFQVIYLLQTIEGKPKIFAYITGDEQGVLKEHGLI